MNHQQEEGHISNHASKAGDWAPGIIGCGGVAEPTGAPNLPEAKKVRWNGQAKKSKMSAEVQKGISARVQKGTDLE